MNDMQKPYWANLDALRFIAFFGVFIAHAWSLWLPEMRVPVWMKEIRTWSQVGGLGLNFLFVLSGFLISYLLLLEENMKGKFSIRRYYVRRTLRIWPLYFLVVLGSFLVLPYIMHALGRPFPETANPWYYIFFISNFYILTVGYPYSPLLAVMWSLAVEEQFYVVWPWLMKGFRKFRTPIFLLLIIISLVFRFIHEHDSKTLFFHTLSVLSDFAIGGWLAFIAIQKGKFFHRFTSISRPAIGVIYLVIFLMIIFYRQLFHSPIMIVSERVIFGIAFSFIIMEQAFCTNRLFDLSLIPGFAWLGKISYGLYCFHELAILLAKDFLIREQLLYKPMGHFIFLPMVAFIIIVPIAVVSYYGYEKWFLEWKKRFELPSSP